MSGASVPQDIDVLFVYGAGDVAFSGKHLIFLEDDIDRLSQFMESETATRLLGDKRVEFHFLTEEVLKGLLWRFCFKKSALMAVKKDRFDQIQKQFNELKEGIFLVASDYRDFGLRVLDNVLKNYELEMVDGLQLKVGGPAIIVGAGPSLDQEKDELQRLSQRALILAAGSAASVVDADAVVAYDPDPVIQQARGRPLFFQNRVSHKYLEAWDGLKVNMGSSGGHLVESYLMGKERFFDGGWNVANFATAVAFSLGCSPIILVGVDLQGSKYAEGVVGEKSSAEFNLAAKFFEDLACEHPERVWLNASVGGRKLKGFDDIALSELELTGEKKQLPKGDVLKGKGEKQVFIESLERCEMAVSHLLKGPNALYEVELDEELANQIFLAPLWGVWQHFVESKMVFYQRVLNEALLRFGRAVNGS